MKVPEILLFASNAELATVAGAAFLLLAGLARYGESRRMRRQRIDRIGWMPWTGLFLVSAVVGLTLLALGLPGLLKD